MSSASRSARREEPELPPTRRTLAMTHPELGSLGEEIIRDIMEITDEGKQRSNSSVVGVLPQLFDKVLSFVRDALATRWSCVLGRADV